MTKLNGLTFAALVGCWFIAKGLIHAQRAGLNPTAMMGSQSVIEMPTSPTETEEDETRSPARQQTQAAYDQLRSVIYARATHLRTASYSQENPRKWLDEYYRQVGGDVAALYEKYQVPGGEAEPFTETANRLTELAAIALAIDWSTGGDLTTEPVDLPAVLNYYDSVILPTEEDTNNEGK